MSTCTRAHRSVQHVGFARPIALHELLDIRGGARATAGAPPVLVRTSYDDKGLLVDSLEVVPVAR